MCPSPGAVPPWLKTNHSSRIPSLWLQSCWEGRGCSQSHWERQAVDMRSTRQLTSLEPGDSITHSALGQ